MKKILVAFGSSSFSSGALEHALHISAKQKSLIVGVFIEDLSYIGYAALFGEDYFAFDAHLLNRMEKESEGKTEENMASFMEKCNAAGVNFKTHLDKGVPANELVKESRYADLIILGYQDFFSGVAGEGSILKDVLLDAECPVLIVPGNYMPIENILFAFDSKPHSAFAIKQFTLLFPEDIFHAAATLIHIVKSKEESTEQHGGLIREYLKAHYVNLNEETISGQPDDAILNFAEMQANPLVVMGAYGRSGVSRFFSRSTAGKLLKDKSLPVFIAHK
ncbi:MAG: universal stress protein [Chitinophagales bacterium]